MGYLCPVCGEPFGGAASLTDHLAVSAILHGGDHERWLADAVDDWTSVPRAELADTLADRAAETDDDHEHPGEGHAGHDHRTGHAKRPSPERPGAGDDLLGPEADRLDADATAILREAQALTQAMQAGTGAGETADGGENDTVDGGQNNTVDDGQNDTPNGGQKDAAEGRLDSDGDDERKES
jgi:hypothetical protein